MTRKNPSAHATRPSTESRGGFTLPLWVLGLIGVVFVGVVIFAGVILFQVVEEFVASGPFAAATLPAPRPTDQAVLPETAEPGSTAEPVENPGQAPALFNAIRPTDRTTVLLLGIDQPCEHIEEPQRSDTMIVLTLDPLSNTAGVMSIPRDLWVPIPGFGSHRINTAFRSGQAYDYPGGGPALAVQTVQNNLGIHIHHYVTVNYDGFIQAIDLIGGIKVDVPESIQDPKYPDRCYGYDPFYLAAGSHHLDGETALKYARTRATFGADFDRAARQQAVMLAAWDAVLEQNLTLLARGPEMWSAFATNVTTDMTYQEALGLALAALEIPHENIQHAVIDYNYVYDYVAQDGAQVLVPYRERIRELRDLFFSSIKAPETEDEATRLAAEGARILVLNGTWTPGLAGRTADYLQSFGLHIAGVDDADEKDYLYTQIIDYGGKPATVDFVADMLSISDGNIYGGPSQGGEYDIKLILGTDWVVPEE